MFAQCLLTAVLTALIMGVFLVIAFVVVYSYEKKKAAKMAENALNGLFGENKE